MGAPDGQFVGVSARTAYTCGERLDGAVVCWQLDGSEIPDLPGGLVHDLAPELLTWCMVGDDGSIQCEAVWPDQAPPPEGRFSTIVAGMIHFCGLRTDGTVACWGKR